METLSSNRMKPNLNRHEDQNESDGRLLGCATM